MDIATFIVHVLAGIVGSTIAGGIFKPLALAAFSTAIAGIVGGGIGGQILGAIFDLPMIASGPFNLLDCLAHAANACIGGAITLAIIGLLRSEVSK